MVKILFKAILGSVGGIGGLCYNRGEILQWQYPAMFIENWFDRIFPPYQLAFVVRGVWNPVTKVFAG